MADSSWDPAGAAAEAAAPNSGREGLSPEAAEALGAASAASAADNEPEDNTIGYDADRVCVTHCVQDDTRCNRIPTPVYAKAVMSSVIESCRSNMHLAVLPVDLQADRCN